MTGSTRRMGVLLWSALVLAALLLSQSGCATTRGFGRDVQSLGHGIERSAE